MADHVYVNITTSNDSSAQTAEFNPPIVFNETRSIPIVDKADDYHLSCVRFCVPTSAIPICIAPIDPQEDGSVLTWEVNLTYNSYLCEPTTGDSFNGTIVDGDLYSVKVPYIPMDLTSTAPHNLGDSNSKYHYVYSMKHIEAMVNNALLSLLYQANNAHPGAFTFLRVEWIASQSRWRLFLDPQFSNMNAVLYRSYPSGVAIPPLVIVNSAMAQSVFANFPMKRLDYDHYVLLVEESTMGDNNAHAENTYKYIYIDQEYPNTQGINDLQSIVMTTTMSVRAEQMSRPPAFNVSGTGNNGNSESLQILSDFIPSTNIGLEATMGGYLEYIPAGEYRLCDFTSTSALKTIDIALWWSDRYGQLRPLNMPPNTCASIKLLLRRKDVNDSDSVSNTLQVPKMILGGRRK